MLAPGVQTCEAVFVDYVYTVTDGASCVECFTVATRRGNITSDVGTSETDGEKTQSSSTSCDKTAEEIGLVCFILLQTIG